MLARNLDSAGGLFFGGHPICGRRAFTSGGTIATGTFMCTETTCANFVIAFVLMFSHLTVVVIIIAVYSTLCVPSGSESSLSSSGVGGPLFLTIN